MLQANRAIRNSDILLEGYQVNSSANSITPSEATVANFSILASILNVLLGTELVLSSAISSKTFIKLLLATLLSSTILFLIALRFALAILPLAFLPLFFLRFFAWRASYKRAESFERDYPAFLLALCSSIRTGLDPLTALQNLQKLFPGNGELGRELKILNDAVLSGKNEEQAIAAFGRNIRHPDITLFRTAFLLARRQGSSLGEALHRLAKVTRSRQSFRRKMRGAVAMQRLSAFGILFCALAIGLFQALTSPAALRDAFADPIGKQALAAGIVLMLIGIGWMIRLTRQRI